MALRPGIDPEWTEQDRSLALAFQRRTNRTCPECGTRPEEWDKDQYAYTATRRYCPGCDLISQEREQVSEQARGVHVGLLPHDGRDEDE